MVGTALGMSVFTLLLVLALQLAIAAYKVGSLHYTLASSIRWAVLGEQVCNPTISPCDPDNSSHLLSRVASIEYMVKRQGEIFGLDFGHPDYSPGQSVANIHICPLYDPSCTVESAGGSKTFFLLSGTEPLHLGWYEFDYTATRVAKAEPYI